MNIKFLFNIFQSKRMDSFSSKEASSLNDISSPLAVVFLFVIGQWTTFQCVASGKDVLQPQIGFETPLIIALMECATLLIFLKINTNADSGKKTEGLVVCFLCHLQYILMSSFCFYLSGGKPSEPIIYLAPVLAIILNYICKGIRESTAKTFSSILLSFGSILFANTGILTFDSDSIISFVVLFSCLLRNMCLKNFQTEKIKISLRTNMICTYVAFLMLSLFIVGMIGNKAWTAFIILGLFAAMISSMTIYFISEQVFATQSVLFVAVLNVYGELLIRMMFVHKFSLPYVPYLLIGAILACIGTIIYLKTNYLDSDQEEIFNLKEKNDWKSHVSNNEFYTRIEFLLFAGSVLGLFVYVLEPRISERDMDTLRYVGLDGLIRKLLSTSNEVNSE